MINSATKQKLEAISKLMKRTCKGYIFERTKASNKRHIKAFKKCFKENGLDLDKEGIELVLK